MGASFELTRHRFTVADYHKMAEAGILGKDDRVELIEGEIVAMAPIGSHHTSPVGRLNRILIRSLGERAWVWVQNPVTLGVDSEPQPDLMVLKPRADAYENAHPTAADVLLLIEVSDTSLAYDRGRKLELYAKHGIVETWIVDVQARRIEVYREPAPAGYKLCRVFEMGESMEPGEVSGVRIALADVFG